MHIINAWFDSTAVNKTHIVCSWNANRLQAGVAALPQHIDATNLTNSNNQVHFMCDARNVESLLS